MEQGDESGAISWCVCVCVQAGYVDGLQGAVLFEALLAEDADADRIALLPDVAAMLTQ